MPTKTSTSRAAWRWIVPSGLLLTALASGCAQPSHAQNKLDAQQRWDRVRAGVKFQLAQQQFRAGRIDDCVRELQRTITLDPEAPAAYVLLAQALFEQGNPVVAARVVEQAVTIAPDHPDVVYMQGVVAERDGNYERAAECYARAAQIDPTQEDYVVSEVECLVAAGRPDLAMQRLVERIDDFESNGTLETLKAHIALLMDDTATALAGLEAANQTVGGHPVLAEEYGLLLERCGRYREAVTILEPLRRQAGASVSRLVVRALASAYLGLGRASDARRLLLDEANARPDDPWLWRVLGQAALACRDWGTASRCADELRRLAPDSSQSQVLTAVTHWQQDEPAKAKETLTSLLAVDPRNVTACCLIGHVLQEGGEVPQAREYFTRALETDPTCEWARTSLEELGGR